MVLPGEVLDQGEEPLSGPGLRKSSSFNLECLNKDIIDIDKRLKVWFYIPKNSFPLKEEEPGIRNIHSAGHPELVPALLLYHLPGDDGLLTCLGEVGVDGGQGEVSRDPIRVSGIGS